MINIEVLKMEDFDWLEIWTEEEEENDMPNPESEWVLPEAIDLDWDVLDMLKCSPTMLTEEELQEELDDDVTIEEIRDILEENEQLELVFRVEKDDKDYWGIATSEYNVESLCRISN